MRGEDTSPRHRADATEIPPCYHNVDKVVWSQASFLFTAAPIFVSKGRKAARICNMGDNLTAHPSAARWSVSPADAGALTEAFHLNHGAAHHPTDLERASWSTPLEIMPYPNPPSTEKTVRMTSCDPAFAHDVAHCLLMGLLRPLVKRTCRIQNVALHGHCWGASGTCANRHSELNE